MRRRPIAKYINEISGLIIQENANVFAKELQYYFLLVTDICRYSKKAWRFLKKNML